MSPRHDELGFRPSRRLLIYTIFFVISQLLYQTAITTLKQPNFDEAHYIPAARKMIETQEIAIKEHPPLGVQIIASGILIFGDNPYGWRFFSALAGSFLLLGLLALCFACGMRYQRVVYIGCLLLTSHFIYVHARIAMLDVYMCALIIWALVFLIQGFNCEGIAQKKLRICISALLWGAATAIKWVGLIGFVICIGYLLLLKVVRKFNYDGIVNQYSWHNYRYLQGISSFFVFAVYGVFFFCGYYIPYLLIGKFRLIDVLREAWQLQQYVPDDHVYQSSMWLWPFMLRPIWYEYYKLDNGLIQGVLCLGNPFLLLAGLVGLAWSGRNWLRYNSMLSFINIVFYAGFFLFWLFVERKTSFHYYYFLPTLFLILALGESFSGLLGSRYRFWAWFGLGVSAAFFVYFFPVISGLPMPLGKNLYFWTWFDSWI